MPVLNRELSLRKSKKCWRLLLAGSGHVSPGKLPNEENLQPSPADAWISLSAIANRGSFRISFATAVATLSS